MERLLAWLNFWVPFVAVNGALIMATSQGHLAPCLPYLDGCFSISRAARSGDAIFLFRGFMMPLSMLMVLYWIVHRRWLIELAGGRWLRHDVILILAVIAALALVVYADFLGTDGQVYRFMRRYGVTFYFAFSLLAQLIALQCVTQCRQRLDRRQQCWLRLQQLIIVWQWSLGLISLGVSLFAGNELKNWAEDAVEWHFALAMVAFYGVQALIWHKWPATRDE
ncbi:hypothetical protein QQM79_14890 [Marinobacteraceae bacterium S3BR75-40.1]